ncbi:MAG: SDR family NAD(P)-dependent oxidoreductase [Opitutales bacterium]|jgi:short-subunit dehydrogenase
MPASTDGLAQRYPTALVTGASSGIGRALALALAGRGLLVYGTSRHPDHPDLPRNIRWLRFDGATPKGMDDFVHHNGKLLTSIDLLINNAGSSFFGKGSALPREAIMEQQNLLYGAPVRLTETVLGPMRGRGRGAVVNVSSLAALFQLPYMAHYSAAKSALSAYTRGLMLTERSTGLVLIDFQPGDYRTAFNANIRRHGETDREQERVWARLEANLAKGPAPEQAAQDLIRALELGKSRTLRSGGFFQRTLAPLGRRLLPADITSWAIRKYYHLP